MDTTNTTPRPLTKVRKTGPEPRYPLQPLLDRTGYTPEEFSNLVSLSRATAHRRLQRGITWGQADDYAIACGLLPWQVWPEWDEADPTTWCTLPPYEEQDELMGLAA
ncbi:hypothetical protein ACH9EU_16850 [Kocuria sp. M1R5S2]|uniref:hypothetical protein n=1 Tax=Kocuria rhizosphaerae TaxID=3376285 RepID=UPI0037AA0746